MRDSHQNSCLFTAIPTRIVFIEVPHNGSINAPTVKNLSPLGVRQADRHIINSLEREQLLVRTFSNEFGILLRTGSFKVHTFVDMKDLIGIPDIHGRMVERLSCVIGDACEVVETLEGNHCSMCRFKSLAGDDFKEM